MWTSTLYPGFEPKAEAYHARTLSAPPTHFPVWQQHHVGYISSTLVWLKVVSDEHLQVTTSCHHGVRCRLFRSLDTIWHICFNSFSVPRSLDLSTTRQNFVITIRPRGYLQHFSALSPTDQEIFCTKMLLIMMPIIGMTQVLLLTAIIIIVFISFLIRGQAPKGRRPYYFRYYLLLFIIMLLPYYFRFFLLFIFFFFPSLW